MKKNNILGKYSNNVVSQCGEDGILQKIFEILPSSNKWCVEFGAWDGKYLSNCYNLITNYEWNGVMIEANSYKFQELQNTYINNSKVCLINRYVEFEGENSLDNILSETPIPKDLDLLSIDIDGNDYYVWESLKYFEPKVVVIEFNPSIPSDLEFVQERDMKINQGSSILSIDKLAKSKGYELIATTQLNGIYVKKEYFHLFGIENNAPSVLWDTEVEAPRIFQLFDGTLVLSKEFDLLWRDIKVNKLDLQKLPMQKRVYRDSQSIQDQENSENSDKYRELIKRLLRKVYKKIS